MTHKDDKEAVIPLNKGMEEQLSLWFNNINLKIDLAKEIENKDKEIDRLNNIINELERFLNEVDIVQRERENIPNDHITIYNILADKLKELKEKQWQEYDYQDTEKKE